MARRPTTCIALLRGINVGGHHKIPMADLRAQCSNLGWHDVRSYIQSGNVVFQSSSSPTNLETELEQAIDQHFAYSIPVVVRSAAQWNKYASHNPFSKEANETPALVALGLAKAKLAADVTKQLAPYCTNGESVAQGGQALYVHFPNGVARSKLTPAVLDRVCGSSVTLRNWRTVQKLAEMAAV